MELHPAMTFGRSTEEHPFLEAVSLSVGVVKNCHKWRERRAGHYSGDRRRPDMQASGFTVDVIESATNLPDNIPSPNVFHMILWASYPTPSAVRLRAWMYVCVSSPVRMHTCLASDAHVREVFVVSARTNIQEESIGVRLHDNERVNDSLV